jgi:hypothetical protein
MSKTINFSSSQRIVPPATTRNPKDKMNTMFDEDFDANLRPL